MRESGKLMASAPKARNVIAWGNALGEDSMGSEALKARNRTVDQKRSEGSTGPTWADGPGYYILRLWRCVAR